MAQTKIVLADYDSSYLLILERVFVREYRFTAEIVLLSEKGALEQYFAEPKSIDILVINEKYYDQTFSRHNVTHLFILTEEEPDRESGLFTNMIYKYTGGKTILDNVISRSGISHSTNLRSGVAKVIMVYSPVGGVGQTTLAAGICALLARNFRRVLFVGIDGLQTFGCIVRDGSRLAAGIENTLRQKSKYAYEKIKPMILSELYDIIPPFSSSLPSLGVTQDHLLFLIDTIKNSGDYDFIVVDGGADFTEDMTRIMAFADQVLLITAQDRNSLYKLHCLLDNIDYSDTSKFILACNKYRSDEKNHLTSAAGRLYPHTELIEYDGQITLSNIDYLAGLRSMQRLGQFFI